MSGDNETNNGIKRETLTAFDAMWGLYPAPVLLVKADRQIVAVNPQGQKLGIKPGIKCFELTGGNSVCQGCLANKALKENKAQNAAGWQKKMNQFVDGYWIPVAGEKDLYVHFNNNITPYVKEQLCG